VTGRALKMLGEIHSPFTLQSAGGLQEKFRGFPSGGNTFQGLARVSFDKALGQRGENEADANVKVNNATNAVVMTQTQQSTLQAKVQEIIQKGWLFVSDMYSSNQTDPFDPHENPYDTWNNHTAGELSCRDAASS
jgi:hypothetical protein